ncbi:hypothetical protein ACOMHN_059523 [Nucella lapillus]
MQLALATSDANIPVILMLPDRKSMSSLAADQGSFPEAERGTESQRGVAERAESPLQESRKSFTSSTTGPKLSPDIKKVEECSDLPSYVSKSKNAKFHKLFKNVPLHEYPIDTYSCAFKGDILLQGMMYVSQNWICFYSKIRARGRLLEIPLEKVISITREKLALIIPNAIGVQVADQKYVFGSFMSRDNTYKLLVTLLKHSQDSVSLAGRRNLTSTPIHPEHGTHSADVSNESDSTEDDDNNNVVRDREVLVETVAPSAAPSSIGGHGEGRDKNRLPNLPSDKVPGFFSWKCMDYRKVALAFSSFAVKLQKVPRTNLLLAVCSVMVVFLLLSAAGLTYKILLLQTRLEMSPHWMTAKNAKTKDSSSASLQWDSERASIHHMHDVLKANLQLLEQVWTALCAMVDFADDDRCCSVL